MKRLAIVLWIGTAAGCQHPLKPVFEEIRPAIQWPPPPDAPRIRYIGELSGEASLKKPRPFSLKALLTGPEPDRAFSTPTSVAARGPLVFVADGQRHCIVRMNLDTRDFRTIGIGGPHPLQWPADVAFAGENLAVVDSQQAIVLLFTMEGQLIRMFGAGVLQRPVAVVYREGSGEWWVLDAALHTLVVFDEKGRETRRIGKRGDAPGEFNFPAGLIFNDRVGFVVTDSMNFRVQLLDVDGRPKSTFGRKGDAAGDFSLPRATAVDSEGHLYVLDNQFENIQIFNDAGQLLMAWGAEGRQPGQFYLPAGIFIDDSDRIWVADTYNRRVQVFQYLRETPEATP